MRGLQGGGAVQPPMCASVMQLSALTIYLRLVFVGSLTHISVDTVSATTVSQRRCSCTTLFTRAPEGPGYHVPRDSSQCRC
jgi:hypothetical protein